MDAAEAMGEIRLPPFRLIHAAYVTGDLRSGMRRLAGMFGIEEFMVYPTGAVGVPGGQAMLDVAIADANGAAVEVIQPVGGMDDVYRRALPADPTDIAFHHVASRIADQAEWDMVMEAIDRHGLDVLVRGDDDGFSYVYIDTRKQLGHLLEFIWFSNPASEDAIAQLVHTERIPR
jgi:hypothetical protein